MEANENGEQKPFSFGFSKRQETKFLRKSAVGEDVEKSDDSKDFVLSIDKKEVKSTKPTQKTTKEYVIPLIKLNRWKVNGSENISESDNQCNLDIIAAEEILHDSARLNENREERGVDTSRSIPLLMQNRVPEGFETDSKLNVQLRPDEAKDADYDQIPIEHFGIALLRGMGWKEGMGVGKNAKMVVPLEAQLRPKGLGLGADKNNDSKNDKASSSNNPHKFEETEEKLELKNGAYCIVLSGQNKDLYGTVNGIDEDNARVMVKLSVSGKVVNLMQCIIQLVSKKNFEKHSKYLNKLKADKYKDDEEQKISRKEYERNDKNYRERKDDLSSRTERKKIDSGLSKGNFENGYFDRKDSKRHKRSRRLSMDETEKKHKKHKNKHHKHHKSKKSNKSPEYNDSDSEEDVNISTTEMRSWIQNDLRVRIIDKNLKGGKYFKEKVIVEDVPSPGFCVCKTADGKVLENVSQSSIETVVPRADDAVVIIFNGSNRGQFGRIMKRDKDKCLVLVQLLTDRDIVLKLQYDEICEYVGDVNFVE